jgi:hypothetical protein
VNSRTDDDDDDDVFVGLVGLVAITFVLVLVVAVVAVEVVVVFVESLILEISKAQKRTNENAPLGWQVGAPPLQPCFVVPRRPSSSSPRLVPVVRRCRCRCWVGDGLV